MTRSLPRTSLSLASACGALMALALAPFGAQAHERETIKPLFRQALPNVEGKSFTTIEVTFGPGVKALPHRHGQAFVYAYVLRGAVRSQLEGEPVKTYETGQSWFEPAGAHHVLTENVSDTTPATLLVTFVADSAENLKVNDGGDGMDMHH